VHNHLDKKAVLGVFLKLQSVEQGLCLLQQTQRPFVLLSGYKVNRTVVQLMQDYGHFVLVQVKFFAVHLLERIFQASGRGLSLPV